MEDYTRPLHPTQSHRSLLGQNPTWGKMNLEAGGGLSGGAMRLPLSCQLQKQEGSKPERQLQGGCRALGVSPQTSRGGLRLQPPSSSRQPSSAGPISHKVASLPLPKALLQLGALVLKAVGCLKMLLTSPALSTACPHCGAVRVALTLCGVPWAMWPALTDVHCHGAHLDNPFHEEIPHVQPGTSWGCFLLSCPLLLTLLPRNSVLTFCEAEPVFLEPK